MPILTIDDNEACREIAILVGVTHIHRRNTITIDRMQSLFDSLIGPLLVILDNPKIENIFKANGHRQGYEPMDTFMQVINENGKDY